MSPPRRLLLGLPKGSLQETTGKLLGLAGYDVRFAGRSYHPEIDDPEIRRTLKTMYERFHLFIHQQINAHGGKTARKVGGKTRGRPDESLLAWAVIGLGTVANISREMRLLTNEKRRRLIADVGRLLLEGRLT